MKNLLVNILHNNDKTSLNALDELTQKLLEAGIHFTTNPSDNAFATICIGGDGAFLRAVHLTNFSHIPFVGINTGHLGFFQELNPRDIDVLVESLRTGNYYTDTIDLIQAEIISEHETITALAVNEFAIKGLANKVIHVDIYIDDMLFEKVSGDGIIISSPIGSTAYNYSCGGSILSPDLKALQLTAIAPLTSRVYRSMTNSVILPASTSLVIKPERKDEIINIISDGTQYTHDGVEEVVFSYSEKKLYQLVVKETNFWKNVKERFL